MILIPTKVQDSHRQRFVFIHFCLAFIALTIILFWHQGYRLTLMFMIAACMGVFLYYSSFGFSSAYRNFFRKRHSQAVEAQLVMLAVASVLFAPSIAFGKIFDQTLVGAVAPVSLSMAMGAFLFGIGMQLGDGCASGSLYTVGGGNRRMLVTLLSFIAGTVIATFHMPFWWSLPSLGEISLIDSLGWKSALSLQLSFIAVLYAIIRIFRQDSPDKRPYRFTRGPWPVLAAAIGLAVLNYLTLLTAGHPWSITWGFTLWGAQFLQLFGMDLSHTEFWSSGFPRQALQESVLSDNTSVMDIGVLIGAALAASLAGRFYPRVSLGITQIGSALLGGLLMGYGARLAYGCNIGAFFSGVVSFSLHGWIWIIAALPGNWIGIKLRPWFKLS